MVTSDPLDNDRERGILTTADRDYLVDRADYSRQNANARKNAIVERTTEAIRDCWLLANRLEDDEVQRIVDRLRVGGDFHPLHPVPQEIVDQGTVIEGTDPGDVLAAPNQLHRGIVSAIALLYRFYGDDEVAFERVVAQGVRSGIGHSRSGRWAVDVEINATRDEKGDMDEIIERLEDGEHNSLNDLEREMVISRLVEEDALDLDALRASEEKFENAPSRAHDTLAEFRERLPIGHEIARLRDPRTRPRREE